MPLLLIELKAAYKALAEELVGLDELLDRAVFARYLRDYLSAIPHVFVPNAPRSWSAAITFWACAYLRCSMAKPPSNWNARMRANCG